MHNCIRKLAIRDTKCVVMNPAVQTTCLLLSSICGLVSLNILVNEGPSSLILNAVLFLRRLPFVNNLISVILDGEVKDAVKLLSGGGGDANNNVGGKAAGEDELTSALILPIPAEGLAPEVVLEILDSLASVEKAAEEGRAFAYTYTTREGMAAFSHVLSSAFASFSPPSGSGKESHDIVLRQAWEKFMHSNGLNPMMYPSLRKFESEIVAMTAWMCHGDTNTVGSLTSGGTESILMAVKAYRELAHSKRPHIFSNGNKPNMIVPTTIHPAFEKAAHYFGVEIIHVGISADCRVDVDALAKAINKNTILWGGSAPQYCHAVVDPIEALATLALQRGLPLHVDACFGGFMLPWLERLGCKIPKWDFRVQGVTSISADIHKYGYSSKGASVILYKNAELRMFQYFAYAQWPGGLFASPSLAGSRPGGMIAAAWAAMVSMGQNGYMSIAAEVLATTKKLCAGVEAIDGIRVLTQPDMTAFAIVSRDESSISIIAVADEMEKTGWKMERQQLPLSLHLSVMPQHARQADRFIQELASAVAYVRAHPECASQGTTGVYGLVAKVPDKGIIVEFLVKFFSTLYQTDKNSPDIISNFFKQAKK